MLGSVFCLITLLGIVFVGEYYWLVVVSRCIILSLCFVSKAHYFFDYFSNFGYRLDLIRVILIGLRFWIIFLMFVASKGV